MKKLICFLCIGIIILSLLSSCYNNIDSSAGTEESSGDVLPAESVESAESPSLDPCYTIILRKALKDEFYISETKQKLEEKLNEVANAFDQFAAEAGSDDAMEFDVFGEKYTLMPFRCTRGIYNEYTRIPYEYIYKNDIITCRFSPEYGWDRIGTYFLSDEEKERRDSLSSITVDNTESAREIAEKYITEVAFPELDLTNFALETDYLNGNAKTWEEVMFFYKPWVGYAVCAYEMITVSVDRHGVITYFSWRFPFGTDIPDGEKNLKAIGDSFPDKQTVEATLIKLYREEMNIPDDIECKCKNFAFWILYDGRYAIYAAVDCVTEEHPNPYPACEYYVAWWPDQK